MKDHQKATKPITSYTRGELAIEILRVMVIGTIVAGALVCPNLMQVYTLFKPKNSYEREKIRKNIHKLARNGLLRKTKSSDNSFEPTPAGIRAVEYDSLSIKPQRWDGKWRLFMFDVPESLRSKRVAIGRKVVEMGMLAFQKSVYISPFACEQELLKAVRFLHLEKYIRLITAENISDETHFKNLFKI